MYDQTHLFTGHRSLILPFLPLVPPLLDETDSHLHQPVSPGLLVANLQYFLSAFPLHEEADDNLMELQNGDRVFLQADGIQHLHHVAEGEGEVRSGNVVCLLHHEGFQGLSALLTYAAHLLLQVVDVRDRLEKGLGVQQQDVLPLQGGVGGSRKREVPGVQTDQTLDQGRVLPLEGQVRGSLQHSGPPVGMASQEDLLDLYLLPLLREHPVQKLVFHQHIQYLFHLLGPNPEIEVSFAVEHLFEDIWLTDHLLPELDADEVVVVLDGDHDVAVRGPPPADSTEIGHIRPQTVTEYHYLPLLSRVRVVGVETSVAKHRHLDLEQKGHDELEDPEGQKFQLSRVHKKDIVEGLVVLLRWDPLAVRTVGHRGVKNTDLQFLLAGEAVACVVGALPDYLDVVELEVGHEQAEQDHAAGLKGAHFQQISDKDGEEDGGVGPGSFEGEADDADDARDKPEVVFVVVFHDDEAFQVEEEEQQFFDEEVVSPHFSIITSLGKSIQVKVNFGYNEFTEQERGTMELIGKRENSYKLIKLTMINQSQKSLVEGLVFSGVIRNTEVQKVMANVDRRYYSPSFPYEDSPQTIGYGATISAPHMHAYALELMHSRLVSARTALDVGSGTGYLTAAMALSMPLGGKVYGIDHVSELVKKSIQNIKKGNPEVMDKIKIEVGDGRMGWTKDKDIKFDVIHVGAAAQKTPAALLQQLAEGGKMIIPVGGQHETQKFVQISKNQGKIYEKFILNVRYVPLTDLKKQLY